MKMSDGNGFFQKFAKLFRRLRLPAKAGVIVLSVAVVGGAAAGITAGVSHAMAPEAADAPAVASLTAFESSAASSSEETSSEPVSSEETSSEETSSEETSSKPTSSKASVSKPASQVQKASSTAPSSAVSSVPQVKQGEAPPGFQDSFVEAYKTNHDVKGKLILSGTKLNYYVTQTNNNTYYLNHNFNKASYAWGNPYMDYRCSIAPETRSDNIVIYGHSDDKKVLQLSAVKQYRYLDFYKSHPTITFNTVYGNEEYKVIGLFLENVDQPTSFRYHDFINATSETAFNNFVEQVKGRSFVSMPVDCQYGDKFITLSTCLSLTSKHSRYVMVARRIRDGESASVDVSQASMNTNMIPASGPLN